MAAASRAIDQRDRRAQSWRKVFFGVGFFPSRLGRDAMPERLPVYELYAIRYATREARRADHFIGGDPHDGPMPMDYFVWVAKSAARSIVIDAGFTAPVAQKRGRQLLRDPVEALSLVGVDAD